MIYDVIIIGGGPAGYTAALYCARANMTTLILEKLSAGGQMATTELVENYPGFEDGIDGFELGMKMKAGAEKFGAKTELAEVTSVDFSEQIKKVTSTEGIFEAKTVIIATGASPRKLNLPEENSLLGRGICYCATCDGMLFKNKEVCVIGGGNTAVADALYLSKICAKVYLIHRRDKLRASPVYMKSLQTTENIEFVWNNTVEEVLQSDASGRALVSGIRVKNIKTNSEKTIDCSGVFVAVGRIPNTDIFKDIIDLDESGYIIAGEDCKTNIDGVFACGDVRTKELRQIINACADGANASKYIEDYNLL